MKRYDLGTLLWGLHHDDAVAFDFADNAARMLIETLDRLDVACQDITTFFDPKATRPYDEEQANVRADLKANRDLARRIRQQLGCLVEQARERDMVEKRVKRAVWQ